MRHALLLALLGLAPVLFAQEPATSPLLEDARPSLFDPARTADPANQPPIVIPEMDVLEAEFENFPMIDQAELLKPGRLVTASQRRVEMRRTRTKAEADPAVQEALAAAAASPTFAGWRDSMTLYYQLLAKRMRTIAPKLRPEIDRMEIRSIQAVIAPPTEDQGILDARQFSR